jgi:histone acetyltransferase (RNA polymerase elongator complex component)
MPTGDAPFVIPLFIPHKGCPHQCAFCNQVAITGQSAASLPDSEAVESEIQRFIGFKSPHRFPVQIAFYGGNFLGLDPVEIRRLLQTATGFVRSGKVQSIRFSTRPDTINPERLKLIKPFPVSTIEIGAQSMDDQVLELSNRGHSAQDTMHALQLLKKERYETGIQMMIGLPGDSEKIALETGRRIASLKPDFVRVYPTLVIDQSPLARSYRLGEYRPLSLDESVAWTKQLYLHFNEHHIRVIRMGLQADETLEKETSILAGPYHPAFGQLIYSAIYLDRVMEILNENPDLGKRSSLEIHVHPSQISTMRGQKNANVKALRTHYGLTEVRVLSDPDLEEKGIRIQG